MWKRAPHWLVSHDRLIVALTVAALGSSPVARAVDVPLNDKSIARFADVREGVEALTRRDDYILQMSPFDRQVRPKSDRPVSEQELLQFIASHVLPWQPEDIERVKPLVEALAKKIEPWKLNLPPVVLLVKTSGIEEGGAAYCRGSAIALPQNIINGGPKSLNKILPHELFHILSRTNKPLREELYESIGFKACNEVPLPEGLAERKITNPDAPINDHYITVNQNGQSLELMPVLFSKTPKYDAARGGTLFTYLDFKLMQLENDNGTRRPAIANGQPLLFEPGQVPGFAEQVGRNTNYIIHPEEILADNFVLLIDGKVNLPTQRVVANMGKILQPAE